MSPPINQLNQYTGDVLTNPMNSHGVVCLLKPPGMTSHDMVAWVRHVLKTKRVGHTGTLDPAATGVLPVCVGHATRLAPYFQAATKTYLAEASFGFETDTLDAVGKTVRECDASALSVEELERVCARFRGSIEQEPPLYSAIKVDGQKLYEIARAGEQVSVAKRPVTISRLEVARFWPVSATNKSPRAFLRVECSSGTYIRSLVRDIGRALDLAATMTFLTRTGSGDFALPTAVTPEDFAACPQLLALPDALESLFGATHVDDRSAVELWQGKRVERPEETMAQILVGNAARTLFALAVRDDEGRFRPEKVFDLRAIQ